MDRPSFFLKSLKSYLTELFKKIDFREVKKTYFSKNCHVDIGPITKFNGDLSAFALSRVFIEDTTTKDLKD